MALKGFYVIKTNRNNIKDFIEKYHYTHNINGCISDYCYALYNPFGIMVGAMFFGKLAMRNQYKRFCKLESEIIELRRLVCVDQTPKNAESFFIGRSLRLLFREAVGINIVVSYADKQYGHFGTIYKASNFLQLEDTPKGRAIFREMDGKIFHDKSIRTKYKGELKPFAKKLIDDLKNQTAKYIETLGKCTFIYKRRK